MTGAAMELDGTTLGAADAIDERNTDPAGCVDCSLAEPHAASATAPDATSRATRRPRSENPIRVIVARTSVAAASRRTV
jgi:hypothetical protein